MNPTIRRAVQAAALLAGAGGVVLLCGVQARKNTITASSDSGCQSRAFAERADLVPTDGESAAGAARPNAIHRRIVSLAPSLTETLFALGAGELVVGVTSHCHYPPEALLKPRVGDYMVPNYEAILALNPDLVLINPEHSDAPSRLDALGIPWVRVRQTTIREIFQSIVEIGSLCGKESEAARLSEAIQTRLEVVRRKIEGRRRPRVLLSIGRDLASGRIDQVYVAGPGSFHGELIERAGGENIAPGTGGPYPALSAESILALDPDVIVELTAAHDSERVSPARIVADWETLSRFSAARVRRICILKGDYVTIPGPRIVLLIEDLARRFHPEAYP